jgi:hypothetical protein
LVKKSFRSEPKPHFAGPGRMNLRR